MGQEAAGKRDAVFFDLDDTLYDQAQPFAYAVEKVVGPIPHATAADLFDTSRRYSQEIFSALRNDQHPTREMYIRRMQRTLASYGVTIGEKTALALQHVYGTQSKAAMKLAPEMERALDWCAVHVRCALGIITNGREAPQRQKIEILGLSRWISSDNVFISDAVGTAKPSPEIFEMALAHAGADPTHSLYIGDAFPIDVLGAHSVHMPVIWFNHRLRRVPSDQFPAEHEVHTVQELEELVKRIVP